MNLVLIRHAESARNVLFKGSHFYLDHQKKIGMPNHLVPITKEGERQAKHVAEKLLANFGPPAVILHSGFARTKQTAGIIKNEIIKQFARSNIDFDVEMEQNHLLRERDAGYAFEMSQSESQTNFPYLQDYWKFEGNWFAVPPGGESFIQVMDRVSTFLHMTSLAEKYSSKTIYAVTHGGTMRAFQMLVEKVPFDKADELIINAKNCEIHTYQFKCGVWEKGTA